MEIERAKSELMQIYGMLNPDKQRAIDTLVKIEPCEDCVSRAELKKWLDMNFSFGGATRKLELFDRLDKELPPVNPQEPKTGHWIENAPEYQNIDPPYICSECGHSNLIKTNYCEQCGARMVESQESEE